MNKSKIKQTYLITVCYLCQNLIGSRFKYETYEWKDSLESEPVGFLRRGGSVCVS